MESGRDLNAIQLLQLYNGVALLQLQCLRILITPLLGIFKLFLQKAKLMCTISALQSFNNRNTIYFGFPY
jgi:hypothetical protein